MLVSFANLQESAFEITASPDASPSVVSPSTDKFPATDTFPFTSNKASGVLSLTPISPASVIVNAPETVTVFT